MKTIHKGFSAIALSALTLGGLGGCGSSSSPTAAANPRTALAASFSKLDNAQAFSVKLSFKDPQGNILKAMSKDSKPGEIAIAKRVLAASLTLEVQAKNGKQLNTKGAVDAFSLSLDEGATNDAKITVADNNLYLHLDRDLLTQAGGPKAIAAITSVAPALAHDGTIEIAGIKNTLEGLQKTLGSAVPTAIPSAQAQSDQEAITRAVSSAVSVTRTAKNTYALAIDVRQLLDAVYGPSSPLISSLGGLARQALAPISSAIQKVPTGTVAATATVSGGAVKELAIDLNSISALVKKDNPKADAPDLAGGQLLLSFDSSAPAITAPAHATLFDIASLIKQFTGGLGLSI